MRRKVEEPLSRARSVRLLTPNDIWPTGDAKFLGNFSGACHAEPKMVVRGGGMVVLPGGRQQGTREVVFPTEWTYNSRSEYPRRRATMAISITAVFENGVFRPLSPVNIAEGMPAEVTVQAAPVGIRFADRVVLPEFANLRSLPGDTTRYISEDRDRTP